MITNNVDIVLTEIKNVLYGISHMDVERMIALVLEVQKNNSKIVVCGAGRVGYAIKGFGMRLGHLGFNAYTIGDSTVPSIGQNDLFIVASGSGETQTIYDLVVIAKNNNANIIYIGGNPDSRIGKLSNIYVKINAPSKTNQIDNIKSIQPMTTLNEQCLSIFFDCIVLQLMDNMGETHDTMWNRHSNLE